MDITLVSIDIRRKDGTVITMMMMMMMMLIVSITIPWTFQIICCENPGALVNPEK